MTLIIYTKCIKKDSADQICFLLRVTTIKNKTQENLKISYCEGKVKRRKKAPRVIIMRMMEKEQHVRFLFDCVSIHLKSHKQHQECPQPSLSAIKALWKHFPS